MSGDEHKLCAVHACKGSATWDLLADLLRGTWYRSRQKEKKVKRRGRGPDFDGWVAKMECFLLAFGYNFCYPVVPTNVELKIHFLCLSYVEGEESYR